MNKQPKTRWDPVADVYVDCLLIALVGTKRSWPCAQLLSDGAKQETPWKRALTDHDLKHGIDSPGTHPWLLERQ